ncbi:MAG TPA: acyltransferase [Streptosporangiaceae bacterium]
MVAVANGTNTGAKKRVPVLDGIRGICALGVVFTHVAFATFIRSSTVGPKHHDIWSILAAGQLSLGPFFLMSGMLLYRPFVRRTFAGTRRPALGKFFLRRASRIIPAFWLVVTVDLLVLNLTALHGPWDVLRPYLLLHIYNFHYYAGMDVLWTVPVEMQFYLALPVLAWITHVLARRVDDPVRKSRRMLIPLGVMVLIDLGWNAWVHWHYQMWPSQYFYPFGVAGLFAIGMALAIWSVRAEVAPERAPGFWRVATRRPNLFWLGAIVAYAVNSAQPFGVPGTADWQTWPAALVRDAMMMAFSFLIMVPLVVPNASSRFMQITLGNLPMRYLGRISYGIYLWHFTMMYFVFRSGSAFGKIVPVQMLLGKYGFWELLIPVLLGTVAIASISFYVLERPVINLVERWVKWNKEQTASSSAAVRAAQPATPSLVPAPAEAPAVESIEPKPASL